mmetsp:Transcript_14277/g.17742  ORF Transcript_14277/g.17742 Transcript_14277/m.17742 type:complete len:107 (-) Transcript_14277:674-994(-)
MPHKSKSSRHLFPLVFTHSTSKFNMYISSDQTTPLLRGEDNVMRITLMDGHEMMMDFFYFEQGERPTVEKFEIHFRRKSVRYNPFYWTLYLIILWSLSTSIYFQSR